MKAIDRGDADSLTKILSSSEEHTLDFIHSSSCMPTPLTRSTLLHHHAIMKQLLHAGASVDFKDGAGWTSLMVAAYLDDVHSCQILLNHDGADVNAKNGSETALFHTSYNGIIEDANDAACLLVVDYAAQPCASNLQLNLWRNFGTSAFATAISFHAYEQVKLFLTYFNEQDIQLPLESLIRLAIKKSSEDCAIIFLEQGIYLDHKSLQTNSLFHMAAEKGQMKLMSFLVELNTQFLQEEWLIQNKIPRRLQKHKNYTVWLMDYRKQVPSLQKLCKSSILSQLGSYYKPRIAELPFPKSLKKYMCLLESAAKNNDVLQDN